MQMSYMFYTCMLMYIYLYIHKIVYVYIAYICKIEAKLSRLINSCNTRGEGWSRKGLDKESLRMKYAPSILCAWMEPSLSKLLHCIMNRYQLGKYYGYLMLWLHLQLFSDIVLKQTLAFQIKSKTRKQTNGYHALCLFY